MSRLVQCAVGPTRTRTRSCRRGCSGYAAQGHRRLSEDPIQVTKHSVQVPLQRRCDDPMIRRTGSSRGSVLAGSAQAAAAAAAVARAKKRKTSTGLRGPAPRYRYRMSTIMSPSVSAVCVRVRACVRVRVRACLYVLVCVCVRVCLCVCVSVCVAGPDRSCGHLAAAVLAHSSLRSESAAQACCESRMSRSFECTGWHMSRK